jgi:hypothetical protein
MPRFGAPLDRYRTGIAVAALGYVTYLHIAGLWASRISNVTSEIHALFFLTLLVAVAARIPAARWIALGYAVEGGRTCLLFVPVFHHYGLLVLHAVLVLALVPWRRRDVTFASLAAACLGASWYAIWMVYGMSSTPWAGLEPAAIALPLYLLGSAGVLARHWIGSLLLVSATAAVFLFFPSASWAVFYVPGSAACAVAGLLALPGTYQGHVGRLHAFAA